MNQFYCKLFTKGIISTSAIATLTLGSVLAPGWSQSTQNALQDSPKALVDEVWQLVNNEFVDKDFNKVDWMSIRYELLSKNYTNQEEAYKAIRGSLKKLGDPYSRFLEPKEYKALTQETSGETSGVGIRIKIDEKTKQLVIVEPIDNSPAKKAGIEPGDKIIKINNKLTSLMNIEQASQEIQGEVGTPVSMELFRKGKGNFVLNLTRAPIELPSVSYSLKKEGNLRVGYIRLEEFSSHSADQMRKAIEKLQQDKANAFVLDLRGNPGGLLIASVDIARMWMPQGAIVKTVDRKGGDRAFSANNTALTNLPLVVLVDENSASASEILAGALKENKRALLVGDTTFGKGTVQSVHTLSDGSGLAVTIARYYTPSGVNISKKGIQPDVKQSLSVQDQYRLAANPSLIGTVADPQYLRAITVLKNTRVASANQKRLNP